jgi:hypothetical protein
MISDALGLAEDPLPFYHIYVHKYFYDFMNFIDVVMEVRLGNTTFQNSRGTQGQIS